MLELRWRKAWRDAWWQRGRLLLVGLAITLALSAAGAVLHTWSLLSRVTREGYAASLPVAATLTVEGVSATQLQGLRADPALAAVTQRRVLPVQVAGGGGWLSGVLFVPDQFGERPAQRLAGVMGQWPPPAGTLAIEASALASSGAVLGQPLRIKSGDRVLELPLVGSGRDVSLAPGWMEHQVYLFADATTLAAAGWPTGFDQLQLRWRDPTLDRAAVRARAVAVARQLEIAGLQVQRLEVPEPGRHIHAAQMESLLLVQGGFALLALLACVPLVINLLEVVLARQVRELAVMKTLGATAALLRRPLLAVALLLGLLAVALSLPAAVALARPYAAMKAEMLNFPLDGMAVPLWTLALHVVVGALLPVLAAWFPVRRACGLRIADSLREGGLKQAGPTHPARARVAWLPEIWRLGFAQVWRRPRRSLLTVLALAVGGAIYLGAAQLGRAVHGAVDLQFAPQLHDFSLRVGTPQPWGALEEAATGVAGIAAAEAWLNVAVRLDAEAWSMERRFGLSGLAPGTALFQPRLIEGRWLGPSDGQVLLVSRRLQQENPELQTGATVTLWSGARQQSQWTVVGVVDAGPAMGAWAPRAQVEKLRGDALAGAIRLRLSRPLPSQMAQLETLRRVREVFANAGWSPGESQRPDASRRVYEDHLLMVVQFLAAMGWVMLVVGALGLASTLALGVLERTREIGILRTLGASRWRILQLLHAESLLLTLLAFGLAIPLSIPIALVLAAGFSQVFFAVPLDPWPVLQACGWWLLLSLLVSALAGAFAARRAVRVRAAEALAWV